MDILIKNMAMPKEHPLCIFICPDGRIVSEQHKPMSPVFDFCNATAVALPSHGDLTDKIDMIHLIEKIDDADLAQDIIGEILALPTVVEASNEWHTYQGS